MEAKDVLALKPGRELDSLVATRVMGLKCIHLHRKPVNPNTIRHANGAKEICEDCGLKTYSSSFMRDVCRNQYSTRVDLARQVINRLAFSEGPGWGDFLKAFENHLGNVYHVKPLTASLILAAGDPEFICKVAVISTLKGGKRNG